MVRIAKCCRVGALDSILTIRLLLVRVFRRCSPGAVCFARYLLWKHRNSQWRHDPNALCPGAENRKCVLPISTVFLPSLLVLSFQNIIENISIEFPIVFHLSKFIYRTRKVKNPTSVWRHVFCLNFRVYPCLAQNLTSAHVF